MSAVADKGCTFWTFCKHPACIHAHSHPQTWIWTRTGQNPCLRQTSQSWKAVPFHIKIVIMNKNIWKASNASYSIISVSLPHVYPQTSSHFYGPCSPWFLTKVIYLHHREWKATFWIISAKEICVLKSFLPFLRVLCFIMQTKIPFRTATSSHTLDMRLGVRSLFVCVFPALPHVTLAINAVSGTSVSHFAKLKKIFPC